MASHGAAAATCADTSTNRSQQVSDFCKNASEIEAYIKTFQHDYPEIPLPEEVQEKLNSLSSTNFEAKLAKTPAKLLPEVIKEMNRLLALDQVGSDVELSKLAGTIISKVSFFTGDELTGHIARIQAFAGNAKYSTLFQDAAINSSAKAMWVALGPLLYSDQELLKNVKDNADKLTATIKMAWPQLTDAAIAEALLKDKATTIDTLKALRGEIDKITAVAIPRVHVFYAYYGDIRGSGSSNRICDATAAVRKACESQPSCTLPDGFETTLCGYDPAPFVEKRDRGAFISYDCQKGDEDTWTRNVTAPHGALLSKRLPRPVVIQSREMEIACAKIPK
jgi:hypothetical protein